MDLFADQHKVYVLLQSLHDDFRDIVLSAWNDVMDLQKEWHPIEHQSLVAHLMWMRCVDRMKDLAAQRDGNDIKTLPINNTVVFDVFDAVIVRFKRSDAYGKSSNIRTDPSRPSSYHRDEQGELWPIRPRVEICWHTDQINSQIMHLFIVARKGDYVDWYYPINLGTVEAQAPSELNTRPSDDTQKVVPTQDTERTRKTGENE